MYKTQNDLSYNSATLDYTALVDTTKIADYLLREKMLDELSSLGKCADAGSTKRLHAERLTSLAKSYQTVAETLDTLLGGLTRDRIDMTNKPERGVLSSQ
jgi:hypothetical protein